MGKLKDISWKCLKCKDRKTMNNCYDCDALNNNKTYPSWSNIKYHLPIIKHIVSLISDIQFRIDSKRFEKDFINDNETKTMKHIWGIKSWDDLSGKDCNLFTMNDFDLTYLKDENKYVMGVETVYLFKDKDTDKKYIKDIYNAFTEWMISEGYDTFGEISLWQAFTNGYNINTKFNTIEEAYNTFKFLMKGFCND